MAPSYPRVSQEALDQLINQGWQVRALFRESNGLIVSMLSKGQPVTAEMLQTLAAVSDSLVEINLASSGMTDALMPLLENMRVLQSLNLSNNSISDDGLEVLASITDLRNLNLYGNPAISDTGLVSLSGLTELGTVYTWGTAVTGQGMANLSQVLPELSIYGQSEMVQNLSNTE